MILLHAAADLLLGASCPGCAAPRLGLCPQCRTGLGEPVVTLTRPVPCPPGFPVCAAAGPYDDLRRRLVLAVKEHEALWLRPLLADQLAAAIRLVLGPGPPRRPVLLVPMPSDPRAVRARGLDLTYDLARSAARRLGDGRARPRVVRLLRQRRRPRDQAGLSAAERWDNLAGALIVRGRDPTRSGGPRWQGWDVVVVDDVVTTGASLTEATRALTAAGIPVTGAAVVAATQRHGTIAPA